MDICEGLKEIHKNNIIHRDLKPENIFISKDYKIKIGDFGISKQLKTHTKNATTKKGTFNYMAPELIKNEKYTNKIDIWALGCILYELCTLNQCFNGIMELINIEEKNYGKISSKYYNKDLQNIIYALLEINPIKRPNIEEVYNLIHNCNKNYILDDNKKNSLDEMSKKILYSHEHNENNLFPENENNNKSRLEIANVSDNNISEENNNLDKNLIDNNSDLEHYNKNHNKIMHLIIYYLNKKIFKIPLWFIIILLLIIIASIILIIFFLIKTPNKSDIYEKYDKNSDEYIFKSIYYTDIDNEKIKLINDSYNDKIYKMEIDNQKIEFSSEFAFAEKGNHTILFFIKKEIKSLAYMFNGCTKLIEISFNPYIDTKTTKNMKYIFSNYSSSKSINFSSLNSENVIDISYMFYNCTSLLLVDLSNLNIINIEKISRMFGYCYSLTSINFRNFNTKKVKEMDFLFSNCISLKSIDLSTFNTENVKDMKFMFSNCISLTSIDLSNFNTINVEIMSNMFWQCYSLNSINLKNFNTKNVKEMQSMFKDCISLKSIDLSSFNTENVKEMGMMFQNCTSLTSIDLSSFKTENVTNMISMFCKCKSLTSIDLSNFSTINIEEMELMFFDCMNLSFIDISNFTTDKKELSLFSNLPEKGTIKINDKSKKKFYDIPFFWEIIVVK